MMGLQQKILEAAVTELQKQLAECQRERDESAVAKELIVARSQLATVTAERDYWERNANEMNAHWKKELAECERERDELVAALSKYGHHIEGCGHGWSCSCGFYAALAKAERREAGQLGAEKEE